MCSTKNFKQAPGTLRHLCPWIHSSQAAGGPSCFMLNVQGWTEGTRKEGSRPVDRTEGWAHPPENPGVKDASFLASFSFSRVLSSFRGRRWTLKIEALPLMSGGPWEIIFKEEKIIMQQLQRLLVRTGLNPGQESHLTNEDLPVEAAWPHQSWV